MQIQKTLGSPHIQDKVNKFKKMFENDLCNDLPTAFWERKKHGLIAL